MPPANVLGLMSLYDEQGDRNNDCEIRKVPNSVTKRDGVYAINKIPRHTFITYFSGKKISDEMLLEHEAPHAVYSICSKNQVTHIDGFNSKGLSNKLNDSETAFAANLEVRTLELENNEVVPYFVTKKEINIGDELVFFYGKRGGEDLFKWRNRKLPTSRAGITNSPKKGPWAKLEKVPDDSCVSKKSLFTQLTSTTQPGGKDTAECGLNSPVSPNDDVDMLSESVGFEGVSPIMDKDSETDSHGARKEFVFTSPPQNSLDDRMSNEEEDISVFSSGQDFNNYPAGSSKHVNPERCSGCAKLEEKNKKIVLEYERLKVGFPGEPEEIEGKDKPEGNHLYCPINEEGGYFCGMCEKTYARNFHTHARETHKLVVKAINIIVEPYMIKEAQKKHSQCQDCCKYVTEMPKHLKTVHKYKPDEIPKTMKMWKEQHERKSMQAMGLTGFMEHVEDYLEFREAIYGNNKFTQKKIADYKRKDKLFYRNLAINFRKVTEEDPCILLTGRQDSRDKRNRIIEKVKQFITWYSEKLQANTGRGYIMRMRKLITHVTLLTPDHYLISYLLHQESGAKKAAGGKTRDKFDPKFIETVIAVCKEHNSNGMVRDLLEAMQDETNFDKGDRIPRDFLITVLTFINWTRPCGLYNMKVKEFKNCYEAKDGSGDKLVGVADHKTADSKGHQPVIIHKNLYELMEKYYDHWRTDPEDEVEREYFFLNTRGRNMRLTGLTGCMNHHLNLHKIDVPDKFTATAVRTAASTSIQREDNPELDSAARELFMHTEFVQRSSYKGREKPENVLKYKKTVSEFVPFGGSELFDSDAD